MGYKETGHSVVGLGDLKETLGPLWMCSAWILNYSASTRFSRSLLK
jgi:hypothetical protein